MAQIFHRSFNTISRVSIFGAVFILAGAGWAWRSLHPLRLRHRRHVVSASSRCRSATSTTSRGLGIDCRYCHTSVEDVVLRRHAADRDVHELPLADLGRQPDARAGARELPRPTSRSAGTASTTCPTSSTSTTAIHVQQGRRLRRRCHGRVDQMPLTWQAQPLHDGVVPRLPPRPRAAPPAARGGLQHGLGRRPSTGSTRLALRHEARSDEYDIQVDRLTDCSTSATDESTERTAIRRVIRTDRELGPARRAARAARGRQFWRSLEELAETAGVPATTCTASFPRPAVGVDRRRSTAGSS